MTVEDNHYSNVLYTGFRFRTYMAKDGKGRSNRLKIDTSAYFRKSVP